MVVVVVVVVADMIALVKKFTSWYKRKSLACHVFIQAIYYLFKFRFDRIGLMVALI